MSKNLGTKPFSIPDDIWSKMTKAEQWAANQKFLDRAIAKGAEFNLATPFDKVRPGSFLEKEINYLLFGKHLLIKKKIGINKIMV